MGFILAALPDYPPPTLSFVLATTGLGFYPGLFLTFFKKSIMLQFILFSCCAFTIGYAFANAARLVKYCGLIQAALDQDLLPKKEMEVVDKILDRFLFLIMIIIFLTMIMGSQTN